MAELEKHFQNISAELRTRLISNWNLSQQSFFLENWLDAELFGRHFVEDVLRIVEYKCTGTFTDLEKKIDREKILQAALYSNMPDSFRILIPRVAANILDFSNKRNVGHPTLLKPCRMDAVYVLAAMSWIMAELIRLESGLTLEEIDAEIEAVISRPIPIIEDFDGRSKILYKMNIKEQILTLLEKVYPERLSDADICKVLTDGNITRLRIKLKKLDKDKIIDYYDGNSKLTILGQNLAKKIIKKFIAL